MSNLWINIRIGIFHLQAELGSLWKWSFRPNRAWRGRWLKEPFAVYDFDLAEGWAKRKRGIEQNETI